MSLPDYQGKCMKWATTILKYVFMRVNRGLIEKFNHHSVKYSLIAAVT